MTVAEAVREDIKIETDADWECPICAKNPPFNAETIAAMEETLDIIAGKIPAKRYHSHQELLDVLHNLEEEDA